MPISPDHMSELMRPFVRKAQRKFRWLIVLSLVLGGLAWCIASFAYYRAHPLGPDAGTNALQRGVGWFLLCTLPLSISPMWIRSVMRRHRQRLIAEQESLRDA